jgi:aspartyl-tRNA(Asn)/glutamyl-tRNA(Gln) amidotransferase subunit C
MTKEELTEISNIIQISLTENESNILLNQLNNVIEYVSKIDNCQCEHEKELQFIIDNTNRFREDIPLDSIPLKDALKNAPKKNENFFKVPKIIE